MDTKKIYVVLVEDDEYGEEEDTLLTMHKRAFPTRKKAENYVKKTLERDLAEESKCGGKDIELTHTFGYDGCHFDAYAMMFGYHQGELRFQYVYHIYEVEIEVSIK